mmetsp:Transcript_3729/g.9333  ORF Transcript_3729/g.9333 Transcript_3729/m.9333 type:complete len:263 (-) Transcript_3729:390-1178(-)
MGRGDDGAEDPAVAVPAHRHCPEPAELRGPAQGDPGDAEPHREQEEASRGGNCVVCAKWRRGGGRGSLQLLESFLGDHSQRQDHPHPAPHPSRALRGPGRHVMAAPPRQRPGRWRRSRGGPKAARQRTDGAPPNSAGPHEGGPAQASPCGIAAHGSQQAFGPAATPHVRRPVRLYPLRVASIPKYDAACSEQRHALLAAAHLVRRRHFLGTASAAQRHDGCAHCLRRDAGQQLAARRGLHPVVRPLCRVLLGAPDLRGSAAA